MIRKILACFVPSLIVSASESKPLPAEYEAVTDEAPPGAGIFTGEEGEWVIYGD